MIRFEDIRARDRDRIDREFLNKRYRLIAESIVAVNEEVTGLKQDSDNLINLGLARIDDVLGPALATVSKAAKSGFLSASSTTPLTITTGLETTFEITDQDERALFAPTPYVVITRAGAASYEDWAILRADTYDRSNGGLAGRIVAVSGAIGGGAYSDWIISASAGIAASILDFAVQATNTLQAAQQAEQVATDAADTIETIMADGPVSSVNGQTGEVSLGITDIPNLLTTLNGKALTTHGHQIGDVQGLQTALNGKAGTGHGHAIENVTGLQEALDVAGFKVLTRSANHTAQNRDFILANTSAGSFTVTLPASPATGDTVFVADDGKTWEANPLTIARNGATIEGVADDLSCNVSHIRVTLVYSGTTWRIVS